MAFQQQKFRELVFQLLYSFDVGHPSEEETTILLMKELLVTKKFVKNGIERVAKIREKQKKIDELISGVSVSYQFDRIQSVERNILRLGVFELLFDDEIPAKVAIAEGIRLARKFGTPESASFVNAILDALYKIDLGEAVDQKQVNTSIEALIESEEKASEASQAMPKPKDEE
jgi:N utilization substance protein B